MFTKIDIFTHITTPKFTELYTKVNPAIQKRVEFVVPPVGHLDVREKLQRRYPDVLQFLTMANIPLEKFAPNINDQIELAHVGNEELAELVMMRPDMFYGAAAVLPMGDVDAAMKELDYALNTLQLNGIQLYTRVGGEILADPKFRPIFARMAELNKPIWIHPDFNDNIDYDCGVFSWPFETTHCMWRLVESGLFNEFPNIKIITHHAGAMVPFFSERIKYVFATLPPKFAPFPDMQEHFKKFYVDTAVYGNTKSLECAYEFYGADHILFGTDSPLGPHWGMVEDTIASIERMNIPQEDKEKILKYNAVEMFKNVI